MDIDVFPNTVEYWGPSGMVFFRNVQVRYMPIQGNTRLTIALERPGASADQGDYADRIQNANVRARFAVPDLSAEFRKGFDNGGYLELAGIARSMAWEGINDDRFDGSALGWGLNLSTNLKFGSSTTFRGQVVYGAGIQNYMNDAPVDVYVKDNGSGDIEGVAVPVLGVVAFIDHNWSEKFSSSVGWSMVDVDNTESQNDAAFDQGNYAIANLLYYPTQNAMMGVEFQYGDRTNYKEVNGFDGTNIVKVQFSFKYNFSQAFYKK